MAYNKFIYFVKVNSYISIMEGKILEYRNGIYQGRVKNNKRNGSGILITDEGKILVGNWKNDQLFGEALVFVNHNEYGFGEFNRG